MGRKGLITILSIITVLLLASCVWVYLNDDRTPPVLTVDASAIVYEEGNESALLQGVTAVDDVDGPVRAAVDKVEPQEDGSVRITYIAMDRAGNVARAETTVTQISSPEGQAEGETQAPEETVPESVPEETVPETEPPTEPANPEAPVITLTATDVEISAEEGFYYFDYIAGITDDIDDYDTLSRRVSVTGVPEALAPGTYPITYSVIDTDGNRSQEAVLNLTVR